MRNYCSCIGCLLGCGLNVFVLFLVSCFFLYSVVLCVETFLNSTPAGIATQVKLYELANQTEEASKVLDNALQTTTDPKFKATLLSAAAEMHMKSGAYQLAATTYQQIIDSINSSSGSNSNSSSSLTAARANLVMACSYFDPERAAKEASALPAPSLASITANDLEESLAPQNVTTFHSKRNSGETKEDGEARATQQRRESQAQAAQKAMLVTRKNRILKRRAKRRMKYLSNLKLHPDYVNGTSLPAPNPERWIPKRLRHSKTRNRGRRGREKQMQGGHQGGVVSQNDLDKFDAKAKADEAAASAAVETKNGGGNKKKKGKKKGKKGKRR